MAKEIPLWKLVQEAGPYVRLAGISGATAVVMGAYGAHKKFPTDTKTDLKSVYEIANRHHFFHTLALLGTPLCRRPFISASFFVVGMSLFCGICYYESFTEDRRFTKFVPIGGTCLILGWLTMIL